MFVLTIFPICYAMDPLTKIELRNSYKKFENCMQSQKNDITECIDDLNKTIGAHQKALKLNPENNGISSKLLLLVNTLNDTAETYYVSANKKKGIKPGLSEKYFRKAAICYAQLIKLYPQKREFSDRLEQSSFFADYEYVEKYVFELKERKRLDLALLSLQKLKKARDSFKNSYGSNQFLEDTINDSVKQLEKKTVTLFYRVRQNNSPGDADKLIYLVQTQRDIIHFHNDNVFIENLSKMENSFIQMVKALHVEYVSEFDKINSVFDDERYAEASYGFGELLHKIESFPDYSSAQKEFKDKINKAIDNFDIEQFTQTVSKKEKLAKTTDSYLQIVKNGKAAFDKEDWLDAYNKFKQANLFAENNNLAVSDDISQDWFNKTIKIIKQLDVDEIASIKLAKLRYNAISYSKWLEHAKNGNFSTEYVSLSGNFQQQIDNVVILKNPTLEFDFFLGTVFVGEKMNSMGLLFNNKHLFRENTDISCIGKYNSIQKLVTILGNEIQLPVFEVIWHNFR